MCTSLGSYPVKIPVPTRTVVQGLELESDSVAVLRTQYVMLLVLVHEGEIKDYCKCELCVLNYANTNGQTNKMPTHLQTEIS